MVIARLAGKQSTASFISCLSEVHSSQKPAAHQRALFELNEAQLESSFEDLVHVVDFTNLVASSQGTSKWAFISDNKAQDSFLDRFIMLKGDNAVQVRRFKETEAAHKWLLPATEN